LVRNDNTRIISWKNIAKAVVAGSFTWLTKKILDATMLFESVSNSMSTMKTKWIKDFFLVPVSLYQVIVAILVFALFYWVISVLTRNRKVKNRTMAEPEFKQRMKVVKIDDDVAVRVGFDWNSDDEIEIDKLIPFCTKHGAPIQMINEGYQYRCANQSCSARISNDLFNNATATPLRMLKNQIEPQINEEWKKTKLRFNATPKAAR
jgi:hypothetical protein